MLACVPCVPCVLINSCLPARRAAPTGVLDGAGEGFSIDWLVQPLNDWIKDGRRRKGKKRIQRYCTNSSEEKERHRYRERGKEDAGREETKENREREGVDPRSRGVGARARVRLHAPTVSGVRGTGHTDLWGRRGVRGLTVVFDLKVNGGCVCTSTRKKGLSSSLLRSIIEISFTLFTSLQLFLGEALLFFLGSILSGFGFR